MSTHTPLTERFWLRVHKTEACWLWTGGKNAFGYGQFYLGNTKRAYAHRFAYEALVGPIPAGLVLDHLCRVHACVNPAHLEPVDQTENIRRGMSPMAQQRRQASCKRGHAFDEVNTHIRSDGSRRCRACDRARHRVADRILRDAQPTEGGTP